MGEALTLFYQIYQMLLDLIFNDLEIAADVTVGWVLVSCFVFGVLIRSILNLPSKANSYTTDKTYEANIARRKQYK